MAWLWCRAALQVPPWASAGFHSGVLMRGLLQFAHWSQLGDYCEADRKVCVAPYCSAGWGPAKHGIRACKS